jgi:hypothetical protein
MTVEKLPEWVDGPRFVEWLERVRPEYRTELTESQVRTTARFVQERCRGSLPVVDAICVRLDLHISEIPDETWTDPPNKRKGSDYPPEVRAQAIGLVRGGATVREVSKSLGVGESTIRTWKARGY